jgi:hypothetical protein
MKMICTGLLMHKTSRDKKGEGVNKPKKREKKWEKRNMEIYKDKAANMRTPQSEAKGSSECKWRQDKTAPAARFRPVTLTAFATQASSRQYNKRKKGEHQ